MKLIHNLEVHSKFKHYDITLECMDEEPIHADPKDLILQIDLVNKYNSGTTPQEVAEEIHRRLSPVILLEYKMKSHSVSVRSNGITYTVFNLAWEDGEEV